MPTPPSTIDVILPLALPATLTYALPAALAEKVCVGSRVVVPLGGRKLYAGIVSAIPGTAREGITLKPIVDVLDATPLLLPRQLQLWQWIASYYMCTLGEVMKAALPSGLKLESEASVSLADGFDGETMGGEPVGEESTPAIDEHEAAIELLLRGKKQMKIGDLLKTFAGRRGLTSAFHRLLQSGRVTMCERLSSSYVPRTVGCVRFTAAYADEAAQVQALDSLGRSEKQKLVVLALAEAGGAVRRAEIRNKIDGFDAAILALRRKGIVETYREEVGRLANLSPSEEVPPAPLTEAQQAALSTIRSEWQAHTVCLLHGVTSSGKTEVYAHLIAETLAAGKQVLYLVPEIALTTQLTDRLARHFGSQMGVYHSKFPDAERVETWLRQISPNPFGLIVGVRSSLFLPFRDLGLIIVDEEHETSYKQQDPAPRYNARDAGIVLAAQAGAKVLLGTATPSLESYFNATVTHKYGFATLTERYGGVTLPEIVVEDVKELRRKKIMKSPLSPRLIKEIDAALANGEQAILFQNRRGYAPVLECRTCGWNPRCTACDVPLTYHRSEHRLVCHYCGATYAVPTACPQCEETDLRPVGLGTEKVEETVQCLFSDARIARMDLDTTRTQSAHERIIHDFQSGRTNLLIGTQMVTKGLDFDHVRVVGILDADQMLSQPNFRAFERAFQLMTQVAGRAGRRQGRGLVVLQTKQVDLPVVGQVVRGDYATFFAEQLEERRLFHYPPFVRLVEICLKHRDEAVCDHAAQELGRLLKVHFAADVLGPDRPVVARIQHLHLRKLLLKIRPTFTPDSVKRTLASARDIVLAQPAFRNVGIHFDVDPF